jgi:AcrR family transcriptional regulator
MEPGGVRERKQAERRARVIEAAMQLAREGGYDAVHMREVSARADVALGTIYRYFSSKDEILAEGLVNWVSQMRERLARRPRRGATVVEQAVDAMRAAARVDEEAGPMLRALMTAMSSPSSSVAAASANLHELMESIVREAIGAPPEGIDIDGVCHVVAHVWSSTISQWVGRQTPASTMGDDLAVALRLLLR